ncbi:hypothetical protein V6N13_122590 [Hibiscus sabdariffa]
MGWIRYHGGYIREASLVCLMCGGRELRCRMMFRNEMAFVREYLSGKRVEWSGFFCRSLRTFEVAMLNDLQACMGDYGLKIEVEDCLLWKHDMTENFSIKGLYRLMSSFGGCGK